MGLPGARHNYAMRFALAIAASVLGACTLAASAPAALTVEPPVRLDRSSSGSPQLSDAFINYSVMAWRNANSVKVARWFKGTGPTTRTLATNAVSGQTIAVSAGSSRAVVAWRTKSGLRFAMSGKEGVFGSRSIAIPGSSRGTSVAITWPSYSRWTSSGGSVVISWVAPTGCGTAAKAISYNPIRRSFDGPLRTLSPKCGHAAMLRASSHAIAWRSGTSKGGYSIVARAVGSKGTIGRLRTVSRHRVIGFAPSVVAVSVNLPESFTNTGTSDLTDITVSDDKCPSVTGPNTGSDATPSVLNPGDTWTYTCSISASALFGSSTAPITNTVTVNAKDELGRNVPPATDTAVTNLLVPGIALDKTVAPGQTIAAGSPVTFNIAVTNTGNTAFTSVAVGDDLCPANLSAPNKGTDASPNTLDPGETWNYTCVVQTTAAQAGQTIVNTATVTGTDTGGKQRTATDNESVQIPANTEGGGDVVEKKGSSRLRASAACVKSAYAQASVTGSNIRSVTFYLNGKKVKTLTKRNAGTAFKVKFRTKSLKYGNYKVRAVVRYVTGASPTSKTITAQFNRCRPRVVVKPKFPG